MPLTNIAGTFSIHEIGRIDGGRGFQTRKNVFRIGGNTFYDREDKIPMKIPEFKRSRIGLIVEFHGILNGFPNQGSAWPLKWPAKEVYLFPSSFFSCITVAKWPRYGQLKIKPS
jgi:hypothetical protein